jgi:hypothetical protein
VAAACEGERVTSVTVAHRGGQVTLTASAFVNASGDGALLLAAAPDGPAKYPVAGDARRLLDGVGRVEAESSFGEPAAHVGVDVPVGGVGVVVPGSQPSQTGPPHDRFRPSLQLVVPSLLPPQDDSEVTKDSARSSVWAADSSAARARRR